MSPQEPFPFTPVSHLTALCLRGSFYGAAVLPVFNMGASSSMTLAGEKLGTVRFAALGQATGLTHLHFYIRKIDAEMGPEALALVLSRMSRLRALSLVTKVFPATHCFKAIYAI
jgi:hypothetical protein